MNATAPTAAAALVLAAALAAPLAVEAQRRPTSAPAVPDNGPSRVIETLARVARTVQLTSYRHDPRIDEARGRYEWDCSPMTSWVLARAAPRALASVGRPGGHRPLAVDFFRAIRRAPTARPAGGWLQVARIADARPGDVFAWQRPRWFRSNNTGHVGFVVGTPRPTHNGYLVRIADASSYNHEDDTRGGTTGYGLGTILFTTDPLTGEGTGYGWYGSLSGPYVVPTPIAIGRPLR